MEFVELIEKSMYQYGLLIVFLIVALEYANAPLPSEIVLPFVGFFVSIGYFSFWTAVVVSILGGMVGALSNYYLGKYIGVPLTNRLIVAMPKTEKSIMYSTTLLKKYGKQSVLFSRFIPLARTMISIPAGIIQMPIVTFCFYTLIGISIWNILLIGLGVYLGEQYHTIADLLKKYYVIIFAVGVVGLGFIGYRKWWRKGY